jgi:allantoinase
MATDLTLPSRDLTGYGARPPHAGWPGDARIAVNFCINYEEGAEMCVLNGDERSEVRVSDMVVKGRPGGRDLNMESNYEYGSRVGYWRILKSFTERGLPATVNLVGLAGELVPEPLAAMIEAGFDLQPHGWRWIDYYGMPEAEERALIRQSREQVRQLTGTPPMGYYAGMPSINTRRLAIEEGYFFDSDCYNDDLPWWTNDFGKPHLVIPYSLETNDSRFGRGEGYQVGDEFFTYLKDSFDILYAEGEESPKMMTIGLHARLLGRPAALDGSAPGGLKRADRDSNAASSRLNPAAG